MIKILLSRKVAAYILFLLVLVLTLSTLLPTELTTSPEEYEALRVNKPLVFWLSEHLRTTKIIKNPLFIGLSIFLFLSTLFCTAQRVWQRLRLKKEEFPIDKAFSFLIEKVSPHNIEDLRIRTTKIFEKKKWLYEVKDIPRGLQIRAKKGIDRGLFGSVLFHLGIVIIFLAAPVSALTTFRGTIVVTEGIPIKLKDAFISIEDKEIPALLGESSLFIKELRGEFYKGIYKYEFGGRLNIDGVDYDYSVNKAFNHKGFQFTLNEFGYSPWVTIKDANGNLLFDYFLNIRDMAGGDYFNLSEKKRIHVVFFPDFFREGDRIGNRSAEIKNPVIMVRFLDSGREYAKDLIKLGEEKHIGDDIVSFKEVRPWGGFIIVRDSGVGLLWVGFIIGVLGLLLRFLSNEKLFEFAFEKLDDNNTKISIKGYSRYYPAFLEREVNVIAEGLLNEQI